MQVMVREQESQAAISGPRWDLCTIQLSNASTTRFVGSEIALFHRLLYLVSTVTEQLSMRLSRLHLDRWCSVPGLGPNRITHAAGM